MGVSQQQQGESFRSDLLQVQEWGETATDEKGNDDLQTKHKIS